MTKRDEQKILEILEDRFKRRSEQIGVERLTWKPEKLTKKNEIIIKRRLEKELTEFETRLMIFLKPFGENIEEKIAEIVEEQERVHVCHRDEIQKLQETVREQEEKIEKLTDVIWCVHISLGDWVKHFQSTPKTPYNPFDDLE